MSRSLHDVAPALKPASARGKLAALRGGATSISLRITLIVFLTFSQPLLACTVCMGAPGDPLVRGANNGVWVLLGVIFAVQIGFIALFVTFWKRARQQKKFREQFRVVTSGGSQ